MKDRPHLLLVEDEPSLGKVIADSLKQQGYEITHALNGEKGYSYFNTQPFQLVVLDVMLPNIDGYTLAKQIRNVNKEIPILFLTAKNTNDDLVKGYQSGGNDYLKKPFSLDELYLRVAELLKRYNKQPIKQNTEISIGKFIYLPVKQELHFENNIAKLSKKECDVLQFLYDNKNQITDRKSVLLQLWGDDNFFNTRTMDVFITRLRKHFAADPNIEILNVRGVGYKLIC
jgi:DNA-binding response OmpR family regulator